MPKYTMLPFYDMNYFLFITPDDIAKMQNALKLFASHLCTRTVSVSTCNNCYRKCNVHFVLPRKQFMTTRVFYFTAKILHKLAVTNTAIKWPHFQYHSYLMLKPSLFAFKLILHLFHSVNGHKPSCPYLWHLVCE